ncbi:cytochrome c oxidase subunit 6C-like isoform X2 [Schistocerca gregaria]|uniref:cytochrome c oxidase subunit 6C isoform X2 n=1 Tax=Schistocerca gregaria TaxID=7010 RepID=UPI00211E7CF1|nr:cytochrome c oxidase subunit 6C isoform X2 [Schistocerca gregaria]XP_049834743.1 cytochrome c oxidase subunit 6C-like isoform X2 [Schistocerca gregaria]
MPTKTEMTDCGDLPKPEMRGLALKHAKRGFSFGLALAIGAALSYKIFVASARKRDFAEFYKNFDPEAAVERMVEAGVLQSGKYADKKKGTFW